MNDHLELLQQLYPGVEPTEEFNNRLDTLRQRIQESPGGA